MLYPVSDPQENIASEAGLLFLGRVPDKPDPKTGTSTAQSLYDRWSHMGKPTAVFFPDPAVGLSAEAWQAVQQNIAAVDRQNAFLARLKEDSRCIVAYYADEDGLKANLNDTLHHLQQLVATRRAVADDQTFIASPPRLHTPYRYPLHNDVFVGRSPDLAELTDWATADDRPIHALIAMGGSGKSALAWRWMSHDAQALDPPFEGFFWWDFYHDSDCEKCVAQLLAYLSGEALAQTHARSFQKNLDYLQSHLNGRRILICLDGVERILNHYREFDADAHDALGAEDDDAHIEDRYRACAKQEGAFLHVLTGMHLSKALITSRLLPIDLEDAGKVHPGVRISERLQMQPDDVIALMQRLGVAASPAVLEQVSDLVGGHPLALRALAGAVTSDHGGDLDRWLDRNGPLDVAHLDLVGRRSHVLRQALKGVGARSLALLGAAAAFRGPAAREDLASVLLLGGDLLTSETEVEAALKDLQNRQLLFLDLQNGQCDMHPLVRGVVWKGLDPYWKEVLAEHHGTYFSGFSGEADPGSPSAFNALRHLWFSLLERRRREEAFDAIEMEVHDHIVTRGRAMDVARMFDALCDSAEQASEPVANDPQKRREMLYWRGFALSYSGRTATAALAALDALDAATVAPSGTNRAFRSNTREGAISDILMLSRRVCLRDQALALSDRYDPGPQNARVAEGYRAANASLAMDIAPSQEAEQDLLGVAVNHQEYDSTSWTFFRLTCGLRVADQWMAPDADGNMLLNAHRLCNSVLRLALKTGLREAAIRAAAMNALASVHLRGDDALWVSRIDAALEEARRRRFVVTEALVLSWRLRFCERIDEPEETLRRLAQSAGHFTHLLEDYLALGKLYQAGARAWRKVGEPERAAEFAQRALGFSLQPDGTTAFAAVAQDCLSLLTDLGASTTPISPPPPLKDKTRLVQQRIETSLLHRER
ncbi:hypothetical protein [Primorskyibacter sp. 2E233]|uniref:hypothetical protein n=1 Tax=Primorskyibacter sp. 2E233 TaxID=3413431 RepID=UPI003BF05D24